MRWSVVLRAVVLPVMAVIALFVLILQGDEIPHATLAIFAVTFALLADIATLARGYLQNACVVVATVVLGLAGVEAVGEARMPDVVSTKTVPWVKDDILGYHGKAPGPMHVTETIDGHLAYSVTYTLDDALRRLTRSPEDGPKVRFFGDSYTFGEGLNDADTLPQRFADMTGANVQNYGYPSFSPAQALRALQLGLYDKDLAGTKLVILQTAPFHIERVACKPEWVRNFPRYKLVHGELTFAGRCHPSHGQSTGIYNLLIKGLDRRINDADVETYTAIVDAFIDLARHKYGAAVMIMSMSKGWLYLPGSKILPQQVENSFRRAGAIVVDDDVPTKPGETLEIPYDGHPNATADKLYARKLVDTIEKLRPDILGNAVLSQSSGVNQHQTSR